ncbi:unnamed protein product, partial [Symbiodinium necroappetens]
VGALWNMLRSRDMLPMNAHGVSQFNCDIFYVLGHEICGGETDEYNIARVLYNTNRSAKNMAGIIVGGKAWGSLRKHYGGSFETARAATQEHQVLKDSNAKAFCVSRNRYSFNYIAFEQLAQPPSTARSLINQYLRAANIQPGDVGTELMDGKFVVAGPADGTALDSAASPADGVRTTNQSSASSVAAYTTIAQQPEDGEHYDANLVFKSTLRRGMEEYGLRPLSHGRFTGVILTCNVAETVPLSQIQKRLREDNIDVDATIEAIYKFQNLKPPDKVKEATNFVTPLVDEIFLAMKPWTQVKNYGKNSEQDNQVAQRMQELEEEAATYKQRLKSAGMEVTPTKALPLQAPPSGPSGSQQTPSPQHDAQPRGALPDSAHEDPPSKRRRTQRGDRKKQYEAMLEEPFNVIKQSGQQPPTSMTSIKTWVTNLKKTMPAEKHKDLDQHIQQVQTLLDEGKYTKVQLGYTMGTANLTHHGSGGLPQNLTAAYRGSYLLGCLKDANYFASAPRAPARRYDLQTAATGGRLGAVFAFLYQPLQRRSYKTDFEKKVLWNHMRKVTTQGRHWKPEPCKCHDFMYDHPRAEYHEGHVATGLETLEFCKGRSNLGAAFANVGACNAFFPSKRRLHDQILNQLRGWLKHHLFPNDDRIMENFEAFFEKQWHRHKEHQRHEPRLTHRLIKRLVSALPQNYIIHNEDHANAHLMIYCPNVYNQAAFNTWMDEKTFLLLDKSPEDIKADMEKQTPTVVRKHYKKLLDYNKPIPYGYIMMKRKKQWSKGRRSLPTPTHALADFFALQHWHFSRCSKLRGRTTLETSQLPSCGRYAGNRAIIVDKEILHTNPHIRQLASLQSNKKPVQLEDENCDDFLGSRINANNTQVSYILYSQPWRYRLPQSAGSRKLRLSGYHSRRHMIESTVFPQSLAQQQLQALDDLYFKLGFPFCSQVSTMAPKRSNKKPRDDVELTDVDTNSDMDLQPVRLPHGLPLDEPPPCLPLSSHTEVEQVCQHHLSNGYIPMSVFPWLAQKLPSELLRASALTRRGAPPLVYCSTVSLLHNVNMATHVDKYNQPGSTNVLVRPDQCHRQNTTNQEYNHAIRVKSMILADAHRLACDMAIQHTEITAYSLLEVTHDLRALMHLAQVNKATWLHCSQVLKSTSTDFKIQSNAPWHKRAGRAVDANHEKTPIDIKIHVLSLAVLETMDAAAPTTPTSSSGSYAYSDEGDTYAAQHVLTNATLLKTILKFHTEIRVRMVAVSVEDTPMARHANQAMQGAMGAIVQQHPQAQHTTAIRDYRPQHTLIEKLVSPDIIYSLLLTNLQAHETEIIYG